MIRRLILLCPAVLATAYLSAIASPAPARVIELKAAADVPKADFLSFLFENRRHRGGYAGRDSVGKWPYGGKNRAQRARLMGAFAHMA